ncbi:MAG: hypothetical protein QXN55_03605 [Candidatus Nitrosotenuis sp.]|jgi:hypothetical protein
MVEKHLQKRDIVKDSDPFDVQIRKLYFHEENDNREHSEKVKDKFVEAGNDTRNANQFVKFVNAHLQDKVSKIEKIKAEQNRFWEEMDMFKTDATSPHLQPKNNHLTEEVLIMRDLSAIIAKYGIEKLINALDKIVKQ